MDIYEEDASSEDKKGEIEAVSPAAEIKSKTTRDMDLLLDIPMNVSAELGRTNMTIKNILKLNVGNVIELAKLVGEPMEVYINGLLIARGEVVVVNEKFGIRITDVIDPMEMGRLSMG
jgi:flagellar motor switch protein FliN/FliY